MPASPTDAHLPARGLTVTNLHQRYGSTEVLRGVSLHAPPGAVVAIVGASGSGKSTLLRCLNLLESPCRGSLRLGDETLALRAAADGRLVAADTRQLQRWRARLAMVFQGFNLWAHRTVTQNVTEAPMHVLGQPRGQAEERARQLLQRVGLAHRRHALPGAVVGRRTAACGDRTCAGHGPRDPAL
jgi:arginine/ornithine transport system ATP-binding protein